MSGTSIDLPSKTAWKESVSIYQRSSTRRALWQIVNTTVPYVALWYLMYLSVSISWWLVVPIATLAGAFLVRIFIIFHDCAHNSYFKSRWANELTGFIAGTLTFTPYRHWRWEHVIHHRTSGCLDKRGMGDVWTMTVQEYLESSRWSRVAYRIVRNPLVLFVIAPWILFFVIHRIPSSKANPRERRSVWWTNLSILCQAAVLSWMVGIETYLLIQLMVMTVAGTAGVWLFYMQHQFEDVYWERNDSWDYTAAALQGSSFYKLPRILQWLSGNIGFHHIHHLSPRIPNYYLESCHEATPLFREIKPITLRSSRKSLALRLWDEKSKKLVSFRYLRQLGKRQHTFTRCAYREG